MTPHENAPPVQRVGPIASAPDLLRELGFDAREAFSGLAIGPEDLEPDKLIAFHECLMLLVNCARVSGLDHFGLTLGARFDHLSLGVVGRVMGCAPTLGDALGDYVRVQVGLSRGATAYLCPLDDCFALGFGVYERFHPGVAQAYGLAMVIAANAVRALTGGMAVPIEVHFSHRAPRDPTIYERALKATVRFGQHQTCLIVPRAAMKTPIVGAEPHRYATLTARMNGLLRIDAASAAALLRHHLRPAVSQGEASLASVAAKLGMSSRTLDRRLRAEGLTFATERDRARLRLAEELLALTDLAVGEVASALSYSSHGNFVRAFRRWCRVTPSEWRATAGADGSLPETADLSS